MGSASSQPLNSCAPIPAASGGRGLWKSGALTLLFACVTFMALPHLPAGTTTLATLAVLCLAWQCHLERASLPLKWSGPLAVAVTALVLDITLEIPAHLRAGALLSGLLLYAMIWALEAQDSRRRLQAVASIALLMPFALFTRPAILVAAVFLSLIAMLGCGRKYGGYLQAAMLVFTPVVLCIVVAMGLRTLAIAHVRFPLWRIHVLSSSGWHYAPAHGLRLLPMAPILIFAFGVLLIRAVKGKTGVADFAGLGLLACLLAGVLLHPTDDARATAEIEIAVCAGGMSLISVAPPRRMALRALTFAVALIALALHTWPILH